MKKPFIVFAMCCVVVIGCNNRKTRPAEEILREDCNEGALTMWAYTIREKPDEEQRRIKQSLLEDAARILNAYLLIECENQTQLSSKSDKVITLIKDIAR